VRPTERATDTSFSASTPHIPDDAGLVRRIYRWDLVALVLNCVIGAGIFGLPSKAFALAGTYSLVAYLVCAVLVVLIAICFAEVGSRFSATGGPYVYAREAFGALVGFEVGWLLWLARVTAFGSLANLFVGYLAIFWPGAGSGVGRALVMTTIVVALTLLNLIGVRPSAIVTNAFTVGKLSALLFFVVAGMFFLSRANFSRAFVPSYGQFSQAVLLLVFAFSGFEVAVIPSGEIVDPRKQIPFALLVGIAIIVVLYMLVQFVAIGTLPALATSERPIADASAQFLGAKATVFVSAGALVSIGGTLNSIALVSPRLLFAMAAHGHLPGFIGAVHPRFRTPHVAIVLSSIVMIALTLSGSFVALASISVVIRLMTYAATCAALLRLRWQPNAAPAAFVAPLGQFAAVGAIALSAWLLSNSAQSDALMTVIAAAVGLALYFIFRVRTPPQSPWSGDADAPRPSRHPRTR
jgi:APA family basic amino acid/polyamine antiporter